MNRCYFDGEPCDCNSYDVAGDCPRDNFVHDEDLMDEDTIEELYHSRSGAHDDETERL